MNLRRILALLLALGGQVAFAQNKTDLSTQVKGQLPTANATNVLTAAQLAAQNLVNTAQSGTTAAIQSAGQTARLAAIAQALGGGGTRRGLNATTGYVETFAPDSRCVAGTSNATGWTSSTNLDCSLPGFYHSTSSSSPFDLERTLAYGVTNNQPRAAQHFGITVSSTWTSGSIGSVGLGNCNAGGCGASNELTLTWNSNGLYLLQEGASTLLWGASNGNGSGNIGTTDSYRGAGWAAPTLGSIYSFSMMLPGDGTVIVSAMPAGSFMGNPCFQNGCSFAVRIPVTLPSGSIHSFFVRGGAADFVSDVSLADGFTLNGGSTSTVYDVWSSPNNRAGRILRWAIHSTGAECNYATIATTPDPDCVNVYALIPPNYEANAPNPWFLQLRGNQNSILSFYGTYGTLNPTLFQSGMVEVFGDWHNGAWYGGPQDVLDIKYAQQIVRNSLSLARRPYASGDSAGGVNLMNAITHGALLPEAILCYSCNLSLYTDVIGNNVVNQQAGGGQLPYIAADYGFSGAGAPNNFSPNAAYGVYTQGFDPYLVLSNPTTSYPNTQFDSTLPLLPNAAQILASIPLYLAVDSEGGDTYVDPNTNSVAFCAQDNVLNPGICQIAFIGGGHVSANKFVGSTAIAFMSNNP